jgi:4-diphosphocytidyl-2-C-methyl-D-erythritol kinase
VDTGFKCTLALDVGPRRPDGYHPVDLVLVRLAGGDALSLEAAEESTVSVVGMPAARDNLVWRALDVIADVIGEDPRVAVTLIKHVPVGAGLGGGSADAGAIMRWALDRWPAKASRLWEAAVLLGSDVPFFATELPAARATGRGEVLAPLPPPAWGSLVIATPPISVSTPRVYHAYDEVGAGTPPTAARVVDALERGMLPSHLGNQLERAAWHTEPALREFREQLHALGAPPALTTLSGTGGSYVSWFGRRADAERFGASVGRVAAWVRVYHF